MKRIPDLPVKIYVGGELSALVCHPMPPYSLQAIEFLAQLSKVLLASSAIRLYPDLAAFAYWSRRANLTRLAREFGDYKKRRVGRGLVFHVAPANVPVNFAFSFAFGVLAGNANIVRIPGISYAQVDIICTEIKRLFACPEHSRIAAMNRLIKYPRNDEVTTALSEICHARVLWGGDRTVTHLRAMRTSPRCVDIAFADRYSLCLMGAEAVLEADDKTIEELAVGFYNDVFFLDQNACSSPHLILWQGDTRQAEEAMARFWKIAERVLRTKYPISPIHAIDKYIHLCRTAILMPECGSASWHGNLAYRVRLKELPSDIEHHRGRHGFFFEYILDSLGCLKKIVNERYQTLSCYGVDREKIIQCIVQEGLMGIDRVVPVGKALDIGVVWDGYDLISTLSRVVSDQ
ncbi:MAG: acyl-CoA reductase [Mariprofundaceae bacterium]